MSGVAMGDRHDYVALEWVKGEIAETLMHARQALESYADDLQDVAQLRFYLAYLHQVGGTLQMVELSEGVRLTDEAEQLAEALLADGIPQQEPALELLMQVVLALPRYLEQVREPSPVTQNAFHGLINALRAARGESPLPSVAASSGLPILPTPSSLSAEQLQQLQAQTDLEPRLRRLRQAFQAALVQVIKAPGATGIRRVLRAFECLEELCPDAPVTALWQVASALAEHLEVLSNDDLGRLEVLACWRDTDQALRQLIAQGCEGFNQPVPESLLQPMLGVLQHSKAQSLRIQQIKARYMPLGGGIAPDKDGNCGVSDASAIRAAVLALCEELVRIKEQLEQFVSQGKEQGTGQLQAVIVPLEHIASTLSMLGFSKQYQLVQDQQRLIAQMVNQGQAIEDTRLMDVAGALLFVEAALMGMVTHGDSTCLEATDVADGDELQRARSQVITEVRRALEGIQVAISEFISSHWDHENLKGLEALFCQAHGGLNLIDEGRAAHILNTCAHYIEAQIIQPGCVPQWLTLDTLADVITGVDYYLQRVTEDSTAQGSHLLDLAEESIEVLGGEAYCPITPPDPKPVIEAPEAQVMEEPVDVELLEIFTEEATEVVADIHAQLPAWRMELLAPAPLGELRRAFHTLKGSGRMVRAELISELAWAIENLLNRMLDQTAFADPAAVDLVAEVALLLPQLLENIPHPSQASRQKVDQLITRATVLAQAPVAPAHQGSPEEPPPIEIEPEAQSAESMQLDIPQLLPPEKGGEEIDDELLEIFVEEAGEVLEAIHEYLPVWQEQSGDEKALTEIRRSFHTLKGSGRMVQALVVGELSWAVENLLNRVLDKSIAADATVVALVQEVTDLMPALVEEFAQRAQRHRDDVDCLAYRAHCLSRGEPDPFNTYSSAEEETLPVNVAAVTATDELTPPANIPQLLPPDSPELLDEEVLEIFVEEVGEVIETLHAHLPVWSKQPSERDALIEIRRAFHTLKGSGRMVQALVISELSWAVENLLNQVLDKNVTAQADVVELVQEVTDLLPALLEAFATHQQCQRDDVDWLAFRAHLLAEDTSVSSTIKANASLTRAEPVVAASMPDSLDAQLVQIFASEARGHLDTIVAFLQACQQHLPQPVTDDLIRALHTLKGSAHMAGIEPIAALAGPLERLVREYKNDLLNFDKVDTLLLADGVELLELGLDNLQHAPLAEIAGSEAFVQRLQELFETRLSEISSSRKEAFAQQDSRADNDDMGRLSQFVLHSVDQLQVIEDVLVSEDTLAKDVHAFTAACEQLQTFAADVELGAIAELAAALVDLSREEEATNATNLSALRLLLQQGCDALVDMMDLIAAGMVVTPRNDLLVAIRAFRQRLGASKSAPDELPFSISEDVDPELLEIFLDEAGERLEQAGQALETWLDNPVTEGKALQALQRDLHTIKGGARMAEVTPVADLAHELEFLYEALGEGSIELSGRLSSALLQGHDLLASHLESLIQRRPLANPQTLIAHLQALRSQCLGEVDVTESSTEITEKSSAIPRSPVETLDWTDDAQAERDPELVEIFLEESFDILEKASLSLQHWLSAPDNEQEMASLQRELHTLKGGARMAEVQPVGDLAHELEFIYEGIGQGQFKLDDHLKSLLLQAHDQLADMLDCLRQGRPLSTGISVINGIRQIRNVAPMPVPKAVPQPTQATASDVPTATQTLILAEDEQDTPDIRQLLPFLQQEAEVDSNSSAPVAREMVKVSAGLLEELVNLAGETSIFRSRVEQQVSDFNLTLTEMEATIFRLRDQLRRLDTETQAQILSRYQSELEHPEYEDFDPLEMDRYSQLQQLSRSLFESASDLFDLRETLAIRRRSAESLLTQQARVNTELQEGLMRTRMVPFERLIPRLRRIVRQVASELGKQVELVTGQTSGEMDRTVLEQVIAPLEHMLRNAVDHGIESTEERRAAGKPDKGRIRLDLVREGGDIVLTLSDDGQGIDIDAVRKKAIERGLITANTHLSDYDVLQYIFTAGFSTAKQVTQISGRGVGMDVVSSEIKKLGGSVSIDSGRGRGTTFSVRLPFTVSVNRALMVMVGEDLYAIPLSAIEGVTRVSPEELEYLYQEEDPRLEYADTHYGLRYLGALLETGQRPRLVGQPLPLPVVLVRSGQHAVAIQVDTLVGSREIVVKGLGAQFALVPGISGATLLGDGRVVVILDLPAMLRSQQAKQNLLSIQSLLNQPEQEEARPPLVMVVDDSVTVRKVTTRLLERHGMDAITARDGADAIALLQEHHPDVMLLDIEMPRMDGFEVATLVRHDEQLKALPIIMITSRAGEKHRERAFSIGVNEYLGKPFQETQLLESIERLIGAKG